MPVVPVFAPGQKVTVRVPRAHNRRRGENPWKEVRAVVVGTLPDGTVRVRYLSGGLRGVGAEQPSRLTPVEE